LPDIQVSKGGAIGVNGVLERPVAEEKVDILKGGDWFRTSWVSKRLGAAMTILPSIVDARSPCSGTTTMNAGRG
jgi:hypothetical protein